MVRPYLDPPLVRDCNHGDGGGGGVSTLPGMRKVVEIACPQEICRRFSVLGECWKMGTVLRLLNSLLVYCCIMLIFLCVTAVFDFKNYDASVHQKYPRGKPELLEKFCGFVEPCGGGYDRLCCVLLLVDSMSR